MQPHNVARPNAAKASLRAARAIAKVLDGRRVDPLLGLFLPGIGDALAGLLGLVIVGLAASARVPKAVIGRMLLNLSTDVLFGSLPLVGDVFDFWFQANVRNVALFEQASQGRNNTLFDWFVLLGALALFLVALALPVVGTIWALRWLYHAMQ